MQFIIAFADILEFIHQHSNLRLLWPRMLADQARMVHLANQAKRQETARLVGRGWRRYGGFLGPGQEHPRPFFGPG